jgi:hypothetical protein
MRSSVQGVPLALVSCLACAACSPPLGPLDPGPGNQVDVAFASEPPNGTPAQATPLGTSTTGNVTVWVTSNAIGGSDPSNYFVFRSGPTPGEFAFDGCFGAPLTSLTAGLWKVVDVKPETPQQQEPPVAMWTSEVEGGTGCFSNATAPLEAGTVYLFGLTATGGAGFYSL